MGIVVRTADESDTEELLELWLGLSADGTEADGRYRLRPDAPSTIRVVITQQWLADHAHLVVVAVDDTRLVGFMTARIAEPHHVLETPLTVVVTDAYVAADCRRGGVGRQLFEAVNRWARHLGVQQVEVGTLALDVRAVAFWRSLGFCDWRISLARPVSD